MDKSNAYELVRIVLSVLSLLFGLFKLYQNIKLKQLISREALQLHSNIGISLGAIQAAKLLVGNNAAIALEIGKSEGLTQSTFQESAKLFCNLKNTSLDDIDDLVKNGQLAQFNKEIMYRNSGPRVGFIRKLAKKYLKKLY